MLLCGASAMAQVGNFSEIPIEITAEQTGFEGGVATADDNVSIRYGEVLIYCEHAQYNPETRDILVQGNVRIYRGNQLFTGDRAVYNLETKQLTAADFRGSFTPFRFGGDTLSTLGPNAYLVKDGIFTTSDNSKPDYYVRAKTVRIYPKDRVIFSNAKLYIGTTPVFWFPYLYQSLDKENGFLIVPGYSSIWGAHLLGQYNFPFGDMAGRLRLDLLSDRGVGIGFEARSHGGEDKRNWSRFRSYYIDDSNPGLNKTSLRREEIDPSRYRVSFQSRTYLTEDIYASIDINKLSDARFLQDFEPGEFRNNPNPDNAISITKWDENYTGTFLLRKNLNDDSFDGTERLPEASLDIKRQPLFGSRFFYEGETSAGFYRRNFADGSLLSDYDTFRADTFHQISYPGTYFGWLSVVPRVGIRGTYYADSGYTATFTDSTPTRFRTTVTDTKVTVVTTRDKTTTTITTPNGTTKKVTKDGSTKTEVTAVDPPTKGGKTTTTDSEGTITKTRRKLIENGSLFRPVVNAGVETSFKLSRAYEQVQSRAWGLDGLRHVVQPYANLSFVYAGEDPGDIFQFDRYNRSTQLQPIDFPQFNTIDSIDNWSILRLGVRNRLQTRRDNQTLNWFELNTYFDINIDRPEFLGDVAPDSGTFSNVFNRLRWTPLPWVALTIDSQLPLLDTGFTEVNTSATFFVNENVQVSVGHRYLNGNPLFVDSNLLTAGAYVRFNDNWAFSFRETYEFEDSTLESQRYELHRDLSSWVASLGVVVRDNRGVSDYGLMLTFTLKDIPSVRLPLLLDPESLGTGSGSGKNR